MEKRFETFTVLVNRINRNIRKIKNQQMAEYGLRSAHVSCLYYLYTDKGLTATDLCECCEEDEGYLCCESKTAKRYKSPLLLTEKREKIAGLIAGKIDWVLQEVSVGLTEEERLAFYRSLSIISDSLDAVARTSIHALQAAERNDEQ